MKRISGFLIGATLMSLAFANAASAQQAGPDGNVIIRQRGMQGPEGGPPPATASQFVCVASESFGGKVVKGAPYSGESVTETIQTLSDGNRIVNRMTSSVYRDSEGRTRREQSLKGLGIFANGEEGIQTIFINDPVAGVTFTLDSRSHTANKSVPFTFEFSKKLDKAGAVVSAMEGQRFEFKVERGTAAAGSMIMTTPLGAPPVGAPHPDLDQL